MFKQTTCETVHPREEAGLLCVLIKKILDTSTGHLQVGAGLVISAFSHSDFVRTPIVVRPNISFIGIIL